MSVHAAIAWAMEVSRGEPMPARMLLIVGLATRCGDRENGFVVWPSIRQLAEDCDMSVASVKRWMNHLEERQLVQKFSATREDGGKSSNRYLLPVKAAFFHPTKGEVPQRPWVNVSHGGRVSVSHPMAHIGEPSHGSHGEPCSEQPLEQQLEEDSELPLGLQPIPPKDPTPEDLANFIEEEWRARGTIVAPLRSGALTEAMKEKAVKLARTHLAGEETIIDVWRDIFMHVDSSDFLQGKVRPREGRSQFKLTMNFLLEKRNFDKTIGGRFDGQSSGEPRRGSTSEATGRVLDRIRLGQNRGAGGGNPSRAIARN